MSDGGKGSSPRPFSVSNEVFGNNFDNIFRKKKTNDYQDILTTEECVEEALDKFTTSVVDKSKDE